MNPDAALDAALLAAHAAADGPALARLYREAGEKRLSEGKINAGCFYLVQAYIFALDCGADDIPEIHAILVAHGREA